MIQFVIVKVDQLDKVLGSLAVTVLEQYCVTGRHTHYATNLLLPFQRVIQSRCTEDAIHLFPILLVAIFQVKEAFQLRDSGGG